MPCDTLDQRPAGAPAPLASDRRPTGPPLSRAALAVLLVGFSLSVIDFFIVNVALPTMGRDLNAPDSELELVVAGYGLAYALLLVLGGRLGDLAGRRRLFLGGMATFTVSSLLCGVAPSIMTLVVMRAVQGAAAALMVPQVLATIRATTEGRQESRAVGLYGATAGLSMVIGQILGGAIVSANVAGTGWRGVFLVNVPIGVAALILAPKVLPATRSDRPAAIDAVGTVLLALTLGCFLLPASQGPSLGWPLWTWVTLAGSPVAGGLFVRYELRLHRAGRLPLVPPDLVSVPSVRRGLGLAVPFFVGFGGFMFVYALVTQSQLGLSPLDAGLILVPFATAFLLMSLVTARLVDRFGFGVIRVGTGIQATGYLLVAAAVLPSWPHPSWVLVALALVPVGAGQGLTVSPLFRAVLSNVPRHLAGAGTGVLATTQQASLALGVAVIGSVFTRLVADHALAGIGIGPAGADGGVIAVILALEAVVAGTVSIVAGRVFRSTASDPAAVDLPAIDAEMAA